ncbi:MAG: hypothetical protein ACD_63C00029G0002 [uncultured bacterium]|nr:MAG: hypothetical protein ACD_63C00029G0002 [uncultured bacterium]
MDIRNQKQALKEHQKRIVRDPNTIVRVRNPKKIEIYNEERETKKAIAAAKEKRLEENFSANPKTYIKWKAPEFIYYEKNKNWYLFAIIIFATLIAYAVYSKSFLMAVAFIVAGAIFYLYAQKKPQILNIEINEDGVVFHDKFFSYAELRGFWIMYEPPEIKLLTLHTSQLLYPKISIILTDQDPVKLRRILIKEIPEDKKLEESAVDQFARRIRF